MTTTARVQAGRLADLLRRERAYMAEFLFALAEFDEQRGWLELGYSRWHEAAGLQPLLLPAPGARALQGSSALPEDAAELVRRFPEIVEPLRDGRLCITSVVEVAKVLTAENRYEVLPKFFERSRRDARAVAAALQPSAAPHRDVVTAARPSAELTRSSSGCGRGEAAVQPVEPGAIAVEPAEPAGSQDPAACAAMEPPAHGTSRQRDSAEPLTAELSRLHITVSRRFLEKLEAARAALSHTQRGASAESIIEAGLDLVLKRHASRRGVVEKAAGRPGRLGEGGGLPASVKREVWKRDGGRCQWPLDSGGVCQSTERVEYDHIIPRAMGGSSRPGNLRLLCRFHNDLGARRAFGAEWMNQFTRDPATRRKPPGS